MAKYFFLAAWLISSVLYGANADTRLLQAAIDNREPIEQRVYVIDASIQIPSNIRIDGNGATVVAARQPWEIRAHDHMGMFNANARKNIHIEDFHFHGLMGQPHNSTPKFIYSKESQDLVIQDCTFQNHGAEGIWGDADGYTVRGCFLQMVGMGEWPALPACQPFGANVLVEENTIVDCGSGIGPTGRNTVVRRNRVLGCKLAAIAVGDSVSLPAGPAVVEENYIQVNSQQRAVGILLPGAGDPPGQVTVRNNTISAGTGPNVVGISITNGRYTVLTGNHIAARGQARGVEVHGRDNTTVVVDSQQNLVEHDAAAAYWVTPSTGRTIQLTSHDDRIVGKRSRTIAMDLSEYRGGTVRATVNELKINRGYIRKPDGTMVSISGPTSWSYPGSE